MYDRLPPGADLYATDAQLYGAAGDARLFAGGVNLWESDRDLFATSEDRARDAVGRLKRALRVQATSSSAPRRAVATSDITCSICLGDMSSTTGMSTETPLEGEREKRAGTQSSAAAAAAAAAGTAQERNVWGRRKVDGISGDASRGEGGDDSPSNSDGMQIVETPCGHLYHLRCISAAVDACQSRGDESPFCPVCRRSMLAEDFCTNE